MSLLSALASLIFDFIEYLWTAFLAPRVNEPHRQQPAPASDIARGPSDAASTPDDPSVERRAQQSMPPIEPLPTPAAARFSPADCAEIAPHVVASRIGTKRLGIEEDIVGDSFLSQLEQRTQQVKITLANLEAEKTRIVGLIEQIQPLVPHYDALLQAERALDEAQIRFEEPHAGPEPSSDDSSTQQETVWEGDPGPAEDHQPEPHTWDQ